MMVRGIIFGLMLVSSFGCGAVESDPPVQCYSARDCKRGACVSNQCIECGDYVRVSEDIVIYVKCDYGNSD